jgi:4-hydroxy-3-polyprenylbenzoate decarboxylase
VISLLAPLNSTSYAIEFWFYGSVFYNLSLLYLSLMKEPMADETSRAETDIMDNMKMKRLIVGISGASGVIHGIRLLEAVQALENVETHLIISTAGAQTIGLETDYTIDMVSALADVTYRFNDIAASISSGSFKTDGMVIIPCSMKTLAGVAHSFSDNLLLRAADVVLKDRRRLVIVPRETPLHLGHLRLMTEITQLGGILVPPMPAFYHHPRTIDDLINQTVNRVLDLLEIELPADLFQRWAGGKDSLVR